MKAEFLLEVNGLSLKEAGSYILRDVSFRILPGECWAFTGKSGSGKSALLKSILNHKFFSEKIFFGSNSNPVIKLIAHQHRFRNFAGTSDFYYQQRFNSTESEAADSLINDLLNARKDRPFAKECLQLLKIGHLENTSMLMLSNGEHKRYQIAKALFEKADWLLFDDPFTGLDVHARVLLIKIIDGLISKGIHCLIISGRDIPPFVTHVATLDNGMLTGVHTREKYQAFNKPAATGKKTLKEIESLPATKADFDFAVRMNDVNVIYNGKNVLSQINWNVRNGEKWCISGPNGSGKSTLLSLITADNPQAFANDIYLFDRKRGSGETIWEIKSRIGYVSPELHQYFDKTISCFKAIASGLFDTIGLFKKLKKEQVEITNYYVELFDLNGVAEKMLGAVSHGMQRWVLLARAMVKNPPLIILDEPCQGLDDAMRTQFIEFIEQCCTKKGHTLLYVTHVEEEIPACINKVIKLKEGKIIEISNNEKESYGNTGRRDRA